jgi:hypothetical protein
MLHSLIRTSFAWFLFSTVSSVDAALDCTLSAPLQLNEGGDLTLQQVANYEDGTFTMKLTYTGGQAWIGIGINSQGKAEMIPSSAVIGRADGRNSVFQYSMTSQSEYGSGVQPRRSSQTLRNASFVQSGSTSTLTFTQMLDEPDFAVADDSMWIFAVGLPNNLWAGRHKIHGSFQYSLTSCIHVPDTPPPSPKPAQIPTVKPTLRPTFKPAPDPTPQPKPSPTAKPTPSPTAKPRQSPTAKPSESPIVKSTPDPTANPSLSPRDIPTTPGQSVYPSQNPYLNPSSIPTVAILSPTKVPVLYRPTASPAPTVSLGPSTKPSESQAPTEAPSETPTTSVPTMSPSASAIPSITPTTFPSALPTALPSASPTNEAILVDVTPAPVGTTDKVDSSALAGATSGSASQGIVFFDTTQPYKSLWMAHGIVLVIAWGVCAPIGIGAALLRNAVGKLPGAPNEFWYSIHFCMGILTGAFTIIGFFIAIVATQKEDKKHFKGAHHKAGLAILILVVVQAIAGYFRPGLSKAGPPTPTKEDEEQWNATTTSSSDPLSPPPEQAATPAKDSLRLAWEISHRLLGITLLGLAWHNCHTGIEEQVKKWDDSKDWTGVFWGITAGISGLIFVLYYAVRIESATGHTLRY